MRLMAESQSSAKKSRHPIRVGLRIVLPNENQGQPNSAEREVSKNLPTHSVASDPASGRADRLRAGRGEKGRRTADDERRRSSGAAESHRGVLPEPDVNLSVHPAPSIQTLRVTPAMELALRLMSGRSKKSLACWDRMS
jgi:hypothetical protein